MTNGGLPDGNGSLKDAPKDAPADAGASATNGASGTAAEAIATGGPDGTADPGDIRRTRRTRRRTRTILGRTATALACLLVLFALIAPDRLSRLTPGAFVRIPLEGLLLLALAATLPARARRVAAALLGIFFGLLAIVKMIDMGFFTVLDRPFNLAFDWILLADAVQFLTQAYGRTGAMACVVAVAVLAVLMIVAMAASVVRLTGLAARHKVGGLRAAGVLGTVWIACALLGAQIVPGVPVAAVASGRTLQIRTSLLDGEKFSTELAKDAFDTTPGDELLTGLRGKDVLLAFVESYGRTAVEDPFFAPKVNAVLDAGSRRLRADGFTARSAFLTSSTAGGGSWLAHGTLLSGVWVDGQKRYDQLVKSRRLTLNNAFRRAGWRSVALAPGVTRAWPEGSFFGYDHVYDRWTLGYQGPRFNWGMPPDQYTLSAFQKYERSRPGHKPVMAEIPLVSSHAPWAPTPKLIDWKDVGDGSVFNGTVELDKDQEKSWNSPSRIRASYRGAVEYTLSSLITYLETYGDDDLVVVFVGDHQAAPVITGSGASRDVPITIVARDRAVLDRISGWGWHDGLRPGPNAPVWRMSDFRDRFLTAFGSPPQTIR